MTKNTIYAAVLALVTIGAIVLAISSRASTQGRGPGVIKIGVIAPLTGNVAFLGEGIRAAAKMAEDELASQAGNKWKYQVIVEDDGFSASRTVSAAVKLISVDHVQALVTLASAAGNAVNPTAEKEHVVHFGIASDPHVAQGFYNFIHWTPPYEETKVFVPELEKRGYHRIAIIGANIPGIVAVTSSLENDLKGTNVVEASKELYSSDTKDFRAIIARTETAHPDIYVLFAFSPELELIAKQMREQGIRTPITSIESFEQSDHPEVFEGDWYVNAADATGSFEAAYERAYEKTPSLGSANAYDIVKLIALAAEQTRADATPSSEDIARELYKVKGYSGALGPLEMDADGLVISHAVVRIIRGDKPVTIEP